MSRRLLGCVVFGLVILLALANAASVQGKAPAPEPPGQAGAPYAEEKPAPVGTETAAGGGGFNPTLLVLRMLLGLGLVLVLLFVAGRLITRRLGLPRGAGRHLAVLDTLPLGPGKGILLVRAGKRRLIIGVTGEKISFLREVRAEDLAEDEGTTDFRFALSGAVERERPAGLNLWQEAAAAIRQQVERLRTRQ